MTVSKPETRTLFVEQKHRKFRITIPYTAKVTFGALHPGTNKYGQIGYSDSGNVLRIYLNQTQQIAAFPNVVTFFDLACPIEILNERVKRKTNASKDRNGSAFTETVDMDEEWTSFGASEVPF